MKRKQINVLLVGDNQPILEKVKKVLSNHFSDKLVIEMSEGINLINVPDLIIRNITDGNGTGLRMDIISCVFFQQQSVLTLETISENVYD